MIRIPRRDFLKASGAIVGSGLFLSLADRAVLSAATAVPGPIDTLILAQATTTSDHPLVSMVAVELPPDGSAAPHRHPGPVFGYVLEGKVIIEMENQKPATYRKGQAWYEPPGLVHKMTKNPSTKNRSRFLAVIIGQEGKPGKLPVN